MIKTCSKENNQKRKEKKKREKKREQGFSEELEDYNSLSYSPKRKQLYVSRKHVSRKHVSRKHVSRKHVSRKHVSRKHVSRKCASSANECTAGKYWSRMLMRALARQRSSMKKEKVKNRKNAPPGVRSRDSVIGSPTLCPLGYGDSV